MSTWSAWRPFPLPSRGEYLFAPLGSGPRNREVGVLVYVGSTKSCAYRMASLLPVPIGVGTRDNGEPRANVLANLDGVDYRTPPFEYAAEAADFENHRRCLAKYLFST